MNGSYRNRRIKPTQSKYYLYFCSKITIIDKIL